MRFIHAIAATAALALLAAPASGQDFGEFGGDRYGEGWRIILQARVSLAGVDSPAGVRLMELRCGECGIAADGSPVDAVLPLVLDANAYPYIDRAAIGYPAQAGPSHTVAFPRTGAVMVTWLVPLSGEPVRSVVYFGDVLALDTVAETMPDPYAVLAGGVVLTERGYNAADAGMDAATGPQPVADRFEIFALPP